MDYGVFEEDLEAVEKIKTDGKKAIQDLFKKKFKF